MDFKENFFILDAARLLNDIDRALDLGQSGTSLYNKGGEQALASVGPYLFTSLPGSEFEKWLFKSGWGKSWGILINTLVSFDALHDHFRQFVKVKTEDGEQLYFRFYDPRVLRIFLQTCDKHQLIEFFGPIQYFICEDEDPAFALKFSFDGNRLATERLLLDKVFSFAKMNQAVEVSQAEPERKLPRKFFY